MGPQNLSSKYVGKEHVLYLQSAIKQHYKCSADWTGTRYIGITLDWDYACRKVHLSMPGYKEKALRQFQHQLQAIPQHSPFECTPKNYGAKKQFTKQESKAPLLDKNDKRFIHCVSGKHSYAPSAPLLCNQQNPQQTQ